jgi:kumamolisin
VSTSNPHTGAYSAWLCGYNNCTDSIYQTVTLPSTTTKVVLSYWLYIYTSETSKTTCYDYFHAQLLTSSGSTISNVQTRCNLDASGWTQYTFDVTSTLSSYKGQQIRVAFVGTNDYTLPTDFYVDDVAFTVTH